MVRVSLDGPIRLLQKNGFINLYESRDDDPNDSSIPYLNLGDHRKNDDLPLSK